MKTKIIRPYRFLIICLTLLLCTGCRKEEDLMPQPGIPGTPGAAPAPVPKITCVPSVTVSGMPQLVYVLNDITACTVDVCDSGLPVVVKSVYRLSDPAGTVFLATGPVPVFGPAAQQAMLDAAYYWAWMNRPAGYSIRRMSFSYTSGFHFPARFEHYVHLRVEYAVSSESQACFPYQTLVGSTPLLAELNRFMSGACISVAQACEGTYVTTTLTGVLTNAAGMPYVFTDYRPANISLQHEIMTAAHLLADTMKPAGYGMTDIDFFVNSNGELCISVRYMKCIGGGNT